jgi:hypothetical protein
MTTQPLTGNPFAAMTAQEPAPVPERRLASFAPPPVAVEASATPPLTSTPQPQAVPLAASAAPLFQPSPIAERLASDAATEPAAMTLPPPLPHLPAPPVDGEPDTQEIDRLLYRNLDDKASDLHLSVGPPPWQSVHGRTTRIEGLEGR